MLKSDISLTVLPMSIRITDENGGAELFFRSSADKSAMLKTPSIEKLFITETGESLVLALRDAFAPYLKSLVRFNADNRPTTVMFEGEMLPAIETFNTSGKPVERTFIHDGQIVTPPAPKPRFT